MTAIFIYGGHLEMIPISLQKKKIENKITDTHKIENLAITKFAVT